MWVLAAVPATALALVPQSAAGGTPGMAGVRSLKPARLLPEGGPQLSVLTTPLPGGWRGSQFSSSIINVIRAACAAYQVPPAASAGGRWSANAQCVAPPLCCCRPCNVLCNLLAPGEYLCIDLWLPTAMQLCRPGLLAAVQQTGINLWDLMAATGRSKAYNPLPFPCTWPWCTSSAQWEFPLDAPARFSRRTI